jgi:hypothetical protein
MLAVFGSDVPIKAQRCVSPRLGDRWPNYAHQSPSGPLHHAFGCGS